MPPAVAEVPWRRSLPSPTPPKSRAAGRRPPPRFHAAGHRRAPHRKATWFISCWLIGSESTNNNIDIGGHDGKDLSSTNECQQPSEWKRCLCVMLRMAAETFIFCSDVPICMHALIR
ncbi:unnamed protein product [Urochloa humidicola]